MRVCLLLVAVATLATAASAQPAERVSAILVSPIHAAQIVRGDDGNDHVEYDILVVNVFPEPVTLSSVSIRDPAGKELMRIQGDALAAATQTLFEHTATPVIPASAAVSVEVDLALPTGTAPERVTHRIAYALKEHSNLALFVRSLAVDAPEVRINRQPAMVIRPPVKGNGWAALSGCCAPNLHRDTRFAVDGVRIQTPEEFDIDWAKVKNDRVFDGDGKSVEQFYGFGEDVLAVADGTVVFTHDGVPDATPPIPVVPKSESEYAGNRVSLRIAPNVFALYGHLREGSIAVKVGDVVKAGARIARVGISGPSTGPHLHFGLSDTPDFSVRRSLPFVFDNFTLAGTIDFTTSKDDRLMIRPATGQLRSAYPLYGDVVDYP